MKDTIVDSSAWIEYFKGNKAYLFITDLIYANAICTNDIILTELLPSIIHKKENKLADLLGSLRKNKLTIDWQEVRNIQIANLRHGNNNIGISDILIAQNCIQNETRLLTNDKHFRIMAKYIPLKMYGAPRL